MQTLGNTGEFPLGAVTFNIMSETPGRKVRDTFIFFPQLHQSTSGACREAHSHTALPAAFCSQDFSTPGSRDSSAWFQTSTSATTACTRGPRPCDQRFRAACPAAALPPPRAQALPLTPRLPPRARPPGRSPPAPGTHLAGQQRGARLLPPGDPAEDALLPLGAAAARLLPLGPELPGPGPGPGRGLLPRHGCAAAAGRLPTAEAGPPRRARGLPLAGTRCAEAAVGLGLSRKEKYTSTGAV